MNTNLIERVDRLAVVTANLIEHARMDCGKVLTSERNRILDCYLAERARILADLEAMGIRLDATSSVYRGGLLDDRRKGN